MLTMYFPYNLGPSIVKLHTDHILSVQLSHLFVLVPICYMLVTVLSVCLKNLYCLVLIHFQACTHVISNAQLADH